MSRHITRRQTLALTAAAGVAAAFPAQAEEVQKPAPLPRRTLGRTGIDVPVIAFGCGTSFFNAYTAETGAAALNQALELGINYFDTANSYGDGKSETMCGPVVEKRRKEITLITKLKDRTADGAMRQLEQSLKRLRTDHVDIIHIHRVDTDEDLAKIEAKGGVLEALYKLRDQKAVRAIGITAHADPAPLAKAIERNDFDCVQFPLNAALSGISLAGFKPPFPGEREYCFETVVLPIALRKNMGVLAMKVFVQGKLLGEGLTKADPETLLRYSLSLPVASAVLGMRTPGEIAQDAAWARAFKPMTPDEMMELAARLAPANKVVLDRFFARHEDAC
jgi:aryl-alcohol dehydrogenase-like predicted oxidoreductase